MLRVLEHNNVIIYTVYLVTTDVRRSVYKLI